MTKSGQRSVETHGRASLQSDIIQFFCVASILSCPQPYFELKHEAGSPAPLNKFGVAVLPQA